MRARIRSRFQGSGALFAAASAFLVLGVLCLLTELLSADSVLWTGRPVAGLAEGGFASYKVGAVAYTVDELHTPSSQPLTPVTVYYDSADPSHAMVDNPAARWLAAGFVGWPFAAALVLVVTGLTRPSRRARKRLLAPMWLDLKYGGGWARGYLEGYPNRGDARRPGRRG